MREAPLFVVLFLIVFGHTAPSGDGVDGWIGVHVWAKGEIVLDLAVLGPVRIGRPIVPVDDWLFVAVVVPTTSGVVDCYDQILEVPAIKTPLTPWP